MCHSLPQTWVLNIKVRCHKNVPVPWHCSECVSKVSQSRPWFWHTNFLNRTKIAHAVVARAIAASWLQRIGPSCTSGKLFCQMSATAALGDSLFIFKPGIHAGWLCCGAFIYLTCLLFVCFFTNLIRYNLMQSENRVTSGTVFASPSTWYCSRTMCWGQWSPVSVEATWWCFYSTLSREDV